MEEIDDKKKKKRKKREEIASRRQATLQKIKIKNKKFPLTELVAFPAAVMLMRNVLG